MSKELSDSELRKIYKKEFKKTCKKKLDSMIDIEGFVDKECGLIIEEVLNKKFKTIEDIKSYTNKIAKEETKEYLGCNIFKDDIKDILKDILSEKLKNMSLNEVLDFCNRFESLGSVHEE